VKYPNRKPDSPVAVVRSRVPEPSYRSLVADKQVFCFLVIGLLAAGIAGITLRHAPISASEPPTAVAPGPIPSSLKSTGDYDDLLGLPVATSDPEAKESPRPWVDSSGKHSIVATLLGMEGEAARLSFATGGVADVPLAVLSDGDAAYVRIRMAPRANPAADVFIGKVVKITDGDTLQIRTIDHSTKTVRLNGIDAPESGQPFGTRSQQLLGELVFQKEVRAEVTETDRYGRHLAQIYVNDRWVNRGMVRAGMAWHYLQYSSDPELAKAEATAKAEGIGIWSVKDYVAPWDWRSGKRPEAAPPQFNPPAARGLAAIPSAAAETNVEQRTVYITRTGSKYHRAGCQYLAKSSIPMPYDRAKSSYSPCSRCRP